MSRKRQAPRHHSRRVALQVLYALDLAERARSGPQPSGEEVFERVAANFDLPEGARAFAKELVWGVAAGCEELDGLIAKHALNWRIERMAAVDRNVLRLATFELCRSDTPVSVSIDEAVELARQFGAESSPGFVNGVLDAIAREVRGNEGRVGAPEPTNGESR